MGWIGSFLSGRSQKVVLEGKSSSSVPVLSGVSQGSVLFLIYINDLPEYVFNSTVRLFADDTLLYLTIHISSDHDKLQEDLNNLERWESNWQMSFHSEKCEVIHITTKKTPILHSYSLHGHTLSSVPQIKYLGVHIRQDLKWNSHINSTSSKANQRHLSYIFILFMAILFPQSLKSNTSEYISVKTLSGIHTLTPPLQRQIRL